MNRLLFFLVLALAGCSTIVPHAVPATQASWDGNQQNSGWLGFLPDGSGHITANARANYNQLIAIYGRDFLTELRKDDGVKPFSDGTYSIDREHLADFMTMAEKHRAAIAPK